MFSLCIFCIASVSKLQTFDFLSLIVYIWSVRTMGNAHLGGILAFAALLDRPSDNCFVSDHPELHEHLTEFIAVAGVSFLLFCFVELGVRNLISLTKRMP